jgi:hypothetical protein
MAVNTSLQNTGALSTGVVLVIFRDPDTPANTDAIIERTTTSASVANPSGWVDIGTIFNCDTAGSHFIDYLPVSNELFWYRAKHISPGFEDSPYIFETSGSSQIIPDIDFTTKPWLLDQSPLQLVMVVTSSNSTAWIVVPEVNKPVFGVGTPTIQLIASGNVGAISNVGTTYTINRPVGAASGSDSYVVFQNNLSGFTSGIDKVELSPLDTSSASPSLRTIVSQIGNTTSSLTVNVSVLDSIPQSGSYINLSYVSVGVPGVTPTGSFILSASEARQFTITRPTFGSGPGRVNFTATASLRINDTDSIEVPERVSTTVSAGSATLNIVDVTSGSNSVVVQYSFLPTSTAESAQVFVQESSGSAPAIASVEFTGTRANGTPLIRNDGRQFLTLPIAKVSNYILVTFVPYDNLSRRGTVFTNRYQALSAPLATPAAFTTASNLSVGQTFVSNSVTMPTSSLPDKIRTFLFGAPYGSDITRTAGSGSAQTIIHDGLSPDLLYEWQYFPLFNNGAEGPGSNIVTTTTTTGSALATPVISYSAQESGGVWYVYFYINNEGDYPGDVSFTGEVTNSSFTFLGYSSEQSQFTHFWLASENDLGYARFKATAPGYADSSFSSYLSWFAGSGNPF